MIYNVFLYVVKNSCTYMCPWQVYEMIDAKHSYEFTIPYAFFDFQTCTLLLDRCSRLSNAECWGDMLFDDDNQDDF